MGIKSVIIFKNLQMSDFQKTKKISLMKILKSKGPNIELRGPVTIYKTNFWSLFKVT